MKDLKHYFTENTRPSDEGPASEVSEVTEEQGNGVQESTDEHTPKSRKKRGRVKIKITRNKSHGTICDIVESSCDLVDKTPSPFTRRDEAKPDNIISHQDETPKALNSRKTRKSEFSNVASTEISWNGNRKKSSDENDKNVSMMNNNCFNDPDFWPTLISTRPEISLTDEKMQREESNAFQVLMTRKKPPPVQFETLTVQTQEGEDQLSLRLIEEKGNKSEESKDKKLTLLGDKKAYSKRKLTEIEEAEKMEKRLEKRAKLFKQLSKKEGGAKKPPISRRSGSLHNYFSKTIIEQNENNEAGLSSTTVKAEIHNETNNGEIAFNSTMESNVSSMRGGTNLNNSHSKKKPRWSLRINLQSKDFDDTKDWADEKFEKDFQEKKEGKSRRAEEKSKKIEENDLSGSSIKNSKTKKTVSLKYSKITPLTKSGLANAKPEGVSEMMIVSNSEVIQEISDTSGDKIVKKMERLAPLFLKRQKPDQGVLEARRAFLQSIPTETNERIRKSDRKVLAPGSVVLPFPTISHVTQLDEKQMENNSWSIFPRREIQPFVLPELDSEKLKSFTNLDRETKNSKHTVPMKVRVEEVLRQLESHCPDVEKIWERVLKTSKDEKNKKSPKKRGRKSKCLERKIEASGNDDSNKTSMWTEKYRPRNVRDIFGNEEAAEKVKKWLSNWIKNFEKKDCSSGDDFYSSDCSYASASSYNQVAVILGPHGSGKTASVYAIAEELGYSVIEVNASSKRTGKKILKDLEEATKSHRIEKKNFVPLSALTIENKKSIPQNSLILLEDIDLVFEEDEGFISATYQLATNTKRPIVMTARDVCSHMTKMAPEQTQIFYHTAYGPRVSSFLELVTLAESGYRLPRPCLDRLVNFGDLRRALLQLQYLLIPGKPSPLQVPTNFHQHLYQDMLPCVYKPAMREVKGRKKSANTENSLGRSILERLAGNLDKLSFLSTMIQVDDPCVEMKMPLRVEPSLSLNENDHNYSCSGVNNQEIAEWLRDQLMNRSVNPKCSSSNAQYSQQLVVWKEMIFSVNKALSHISPHVLDRSMLDYLSTVRTICRAENNRLTKNEKRGNRFFHYLQNFRLPAISTKPSVLAAACEMMLKKS